MKILRPKSDTEIDGLLGDLALDEYAQLKANIEMFGQRDNGTVWKETGILLDGRHRMRACEEVGRDFKYDVLSFDTREEAIDWVFNNQFGRRNLSKEKRDALIVARVKKLKAEKEAKLAAEEPPADRCTFELVQDAPTTPPDVRTPGTGDVIAQAAAEARVSKDTVKRALAADAAKPVRCNKCEKLRPKKGCEFCKKAREEAGVDIKTGLPKKVKKSKPERKGAALINWQDTETAIGVVVRLSDRINKHYGNVPEVGELGNYQAATGVVAKLAEKWKKGCTGGAK